MPKYKYNADDIRKYVEKYGHNVKDVIISDHRAHHTVTYVCRCGHEMTRRFDKFKANPRCCHDIVSPPSRNEQIKKYLRDNMYTYISSGAILYKNRRTIVVKYICKCNAVKEEYWYNMAKFPNQCEDCAVNSLVSFKE